MKILRSLVATLIVAAGGVPAFSQAPANPWRKISEDSILSAAGTLYIKPVSYLTFRLNVDLMRTQLAAAKRLTDASYVPVYIKLPDEKGMIKEYLVNENTTMSEELAAKFPDIRAFDGAATDGSGATVKLDLTLQGFHAMIMRPGKSTVFIDPRAHLGNPEDCIVYSRDDFRTDKVFECHLAETALTEVKPGKELENVKSFGTCEHRSYRLALSATGEYTAFHGGTVALAQSAQVTTMNRVNGVYMNDMAISMTIVGNNDQLIFTNAGSDPFTNGNPGSMISQNQSVVNSTIGSSNYDIGHVFGTDSGGLAGLGVVCSGGNKARGVTGSGAPIGDPFDIDYVAHEMGHQFGGPHTFRGNAGACSGNGSNATAVEVGSGSTIMAYAGICDGMNVQPNSDAYFHGSSLQSIGTFITGSSHTCPVKTPIPNQSSPTVTGTSGNFTIPAGTPFMLNGTATDPDGDVLTYCWEQMDTENSTQPPVATATNGPSFRSFKPDTSGTRYFPSIANQLSSNYTYERLSTVGRTMKFRLSVRDNEINGSCNDHADITVTVSAAAGPFVVTYPSASGISWQGLSQQTVTWDVANTTAAPVSAANVSILLSIDGGLTFTTLLASTPNDGSQLIEVPDTPSEEALIIVQSASGTFFDVSNNKFEIVGSDDCYNADVPTISGTLSFCSGGSTTISISGGNLNDAADWRWYSGSCNGTVAGTGNSILITTPGYYYVGGYGGCTTDSPCRTFNITQVNVNTNTNQMTVAPYTLAADLTNASAYQWVDCNSGYAVIPGATSQTYTPSAAQGQFAVIVTQNGCSDTSACMSYDVLGMSELNKLNLRLFPNPTKGMVTVQFDKSTEISQLTVTDVTGRFVKAHGNMTASQVDLDLSAEAKGVYFINVSSNGVTQTMRIVKE